MTSKQRKLIIQTISAGVLGAIIGEIINLSGGPVWVVFPAAFLGGIFVTAWIELYWSFGVRNGA